MNLYELAKSKLFPASESGRSISTLDDLFSTVNQFTYNGLSYPFIQQTYSQRELDATLVDGSSDGFSKDYMNQIYRSNGIVFACMLLRMGTFSEIAFKWRKETNDEVELFGNPSLRPLEKPYPSGTTSTLLTRQMQDADLAGNSYHVYDQGEIIRLAPEWTFIVLGVREIDGKAVGWKKLGYLYYHEGPYSGNDPKFFSYEQVSHFAPNPDPGASWLGISWLTPIIREIKADMATTEHKLAFFRNGATPNMVVRMDPDFISSIKELKEFYESLDENYKGVLNAYKTMYLAGAADMEVVGNSFEQMSFKTVQGAGETRIAADAGTPPVLVGLSEGLQAATYSNYGQARRRFSDATLHPLWRDSAGAFDTIVPRTTRIDKPNIKLWFSTEGIPFLREDEKDASEIMKNKATFIRSLTDAGYEYSSVVKAAATGDISVLEHTGLYSVQLWPPGHEEIVEGAGGNEVYEEGAQKVNQQNKNSSTKESANA